MPGLAFEEVVDKTPDCGEWLRDNNLQLLEMNNAILQVALEIKHLLGIVADAYHAKGVGENDIFIMATARVHGAELVSDEARRTNSTGSTGGKDPRSVFYQ